MQNSSTHPSMLKVLGQARTLSGSQALTAVLLAISCGSLPRDDSQTTLFIVRHAEYVDDRSDDPPLSSVGLKRANQLARVLSSVDVDAVYATQFARTQQTAQAVATSRNLPVQTFDADEIDSLIEKIRSRHNGETVLAVAHGDTVPRIVEGLGGRPKTNLRISGYDDLFVVTLAGSGETQVLHLEYGDPASHR